MNLFNYPPNITELRKDTLLSRYKDKIGKISSVIKFANRKESFFRSSISFHRQER